MNEAQVRPLLRLPDPEQQVEAWATAVGPAEGCQPSAPQVKEVVLEILNPEGPGDKPASRARQRLELITRLKEVTATRKSWEEVGKLLEELETLV